MKSRARPLSARRELHGYDGPMLYLNQSSNPDAMTTVQVSVQQTINSQSSILSFSNLHAHFDKKHIKYTPFKRFGYGQLL